MSCWTESKEENIPLWKLYAGGRDGVKISLPKDFFESYKITKDDGIYVEGDYFLSVLPFDEMFAPTHLFITHNIGDATLFYRPIEYVEDVKAKTDKIVEIKDDAIKVAFGEVGRYKNKRWAFQNETRFVLTAMPKIEDIDMSHPLFSNMMFRSMKSNIDLPFNEYYLKIKESALDELEITLSPSASESQFLIVDALLKAHAPKAKLRFSNLKDKVRMK